MLLDHISILIEDEVPAVEIHIRDDLLRITIEREEAINELIIQDGNFTISEVNNITHFPTEFMNELRTNPSHDFPWNSHGLSLPSELKSVKQKSNFGSHLSFMRSIKLNIREGCHLITHLLSLSRHLL